MTKRVQLVSAAIAALLALVVAAVLARMIGTRAALPDPIHSTRHDAMPSGPVGVVVPSPDPLDARVAIPEQAHAEIAATPTLRVTVRNEAGTPLEAASLLVTPATPDHATYRPVSLTATTNQDGLAVVELTEWTEYSIEARKPGYATSLQKALPGTVDVTLSRAAVLVLETRDAATNLPVGDIDLEFRSQHGSQSHEYRVPATGAISIEDLRPGTYSVVVTSTSYIDYEVPSVSLPSHPGTVFHTVFLFRGRPLHGLALDAVTDSPLDAGHVEARSQLGGESERAAISRNGEFRLLRTTPLTTAVHVNSPGYDSDSVSFERLPRYDPITGVQVDPVIVRAQRALGLHGIVRSGEQPVESARVFAGSHGVLAWTLDRSRARERRLRFATSAEDGTFDISLMGSASGDAQSWDVLVLHPDYAPFLAHLDEPTPATLSIDLSAGSSLSVRVQDSAGRPEPMARVSLTLANPARPTDRGEVLEVIGPRILTDPDGQAELDHMCEGEWTVAARSSDGMRYGVTSVELDGRTPKLIELSLSANSVVSGEVVDQASEPVAGALVVKTDGGPDERTTTAADGTFCLYVSDSKPTTLLVIAGSVVDREPFAVQPGAWSRLVVERTAQSPESTESREVVCRIVDSYTDGPIAFVSYELIDSHRQAVTRNTVVGGSCTLRISRSTAVSVTFTADGYHPSTLSAEDLLMSATGGEHRVGLEPLLPVEDSFKLRVRVSRAPQFAQLLAVDALTGDLCGRGMRISLLEYDLSVVGCSDVWILLQAATGFFSEPLRWTLGDPETMTLPVHAGGRRIRGARVSQVHEDLRLVWPCGVSTRVAVGADGVFATPTLPPGLYRIGAGEGAMVEVELGSTEDALVKIP